MPSVGSILRNRMHMLALLALAAGGTGMLSLGGCSSAGNRVLAIIDTDTVTVADYERAWSRTRTVPPQTEERKREFLDLLVDYRVKLAEARQRGYDRDPMLQEEYQAYRNQLAVSWYLNRELVEPGVRTLYERRKTQLKLQQIEIRFQRFPDGSVDTMSARQKALDVLEKARAGRTPFDSLVFRYSDDENRYNTTGMLNWMVAGTSYPQLDDLAYPLNEGEVAPVLLRTNIGYHVIRCVSRVGARQRLRASQILYRLDISNPGDTAAGHARLSLVLDSLRRDLATFEDLARRNSQDGVSGAQGGDLGWMDRGTYLDPTFERALFDMKVGEISNIVRTPYGLHIIKVTEEPPPPPIDEVRADLRTIYSLERFPMDFRYFTERLRVTHGFRINPDVAKLVLARTDTGMTTSTPRWDARFTEQERDAILFRLFDRPYRIREVRDKMRGDISLQMKPFTAETIDSIAIRIANNEILLHETTGLEQRETELRQLLDDYIESTLISRLEQEDVRDKVVVPEDALRAWWERHRTDFHLPERVHLSEIWVYARQTAMALIDSLKQGADFAELAYRHTRRPGFWDKYGEWGWLPVNHSVLTEAAIGLRPGDIGGPIDQGGGFSIIRLNARDAAREKTFEEARSEVLGRVTEERVQEALQAWTRGLREKHRVVILQEHLIHAF